MKYSIGIDIGGTNSRVALISEDNQVIKRTQFPTYKKSPEETLNRIADCIKTFDVDHPVGIGLSCPGPLNLKAGRIITTYNLDETWFGFPLIDYLTQLTGLPAVLENDANLASLAEATIGDGKEKNIVAFMTVSTGVGCGLTINQKIYHGAHGFAGEVGNVIVRPNGPAHGRIQAGGLEAVSSGTAILKRALNAGLSVCHAGEVDDLSRKGNAVAQKIMDDAKRSLADFIAGLYGLYDPDIVILGGSVALKTPGFTEEVLRLVCGKVPDFMIPYVDIRHSILNEDSGLIGAGILGRQIGNIF